MDLNDFIAQKKDTVKQIESWFNTKHSQSIVIKGQPGNGKTCLVEILAKKYGYYLQRIDPYDFTDKNEFNNILKTLNLIPIDCKETKKLILIENINEFHKNYRTRLFKIHEICKYPIIYTGHNISIPIEYRKKLEVFKLDKPTPTKIKLLLEKKLEKLNIEMDDEIIDKISKQSPSVRSAINSLYNSSPNDITNPMPTYFEQLNNIKYKVLKEDVDRNLIHFLFGNAENYGTSKLLADYDIELGRRFKDKIDKYFFNHMDFNFVKEPSYPEFMNRQYDKGEDIKAYVKYTKDLHVSKRILKREFLELIKMFDDKKEDIKKINNYLNKQNILDFV